MAKLRSSIPDFTFTTTPKYRTCLERTVSAALPPDVSLKARNFARSTASSYWLLQKTTSQGPEWLTLRVATHPLWLENAQQLEIIWENPRDFKLLKDQLQRHLMISEMAPAFFRLNQIDLSTLKLLTELERHQLIWFIQMAPQIAEAHKHRRFDLATDFSRTFLMLGDRNNASHLLVKVISPDFHQKLAQYFGRNLLFSQFTRHQLLKLLPTNQWIQSIMAASTIPTDWRQTLELAYGSGFTRFCLNQIKNQQKRLKQTGKDPFR